MKLRVQHENGNFETITLVGRWTVIEGRNLDRLRSDSGFEHFFTKDGYYDGWGSGLEASEAPADDVLFALEEKREFDSD